MPALRPVAAATHRVRMLLLVLVAAVALAARVDAARADTVGGLNAADRLVIRGMESIDPERLRRPLAADLDLVWLTRPTAAREPFVKAVVHKAEEALRHVGHSEARVAHAVEATDGIERLVLTVTEGPWLEAGAVTVSGLPDDMAARLVERLTTPQPAADAVPVAVESPTGGRTFRWLSAEGRAARRDDPLWPQAGPAPGDDTTLHRVKVTAVRFLRDEGYLGVALPTERRSGTAGLWSLAFGAKGTRATNETVAVAIAPQGDSAGLSITIGTLPPKVLLKRIEILPGASTKHDEMAAFLGIAPGAPVTETDRRAWRETLRQSGRFLRHEVELRVDPIDPAAVVARFDLDEYPPLMPLSRPLSADEETVLRGRRWLLDALAGDTDLVCDLSLATAEAPADTMPDTVPPTAPPTARLVISGTSGLALVAPADSADACGLVVADGTVQILPPGGAGRFDIPFAGRVTASIALSLDRTKPTTGAPAAPARPFTRSLGLGLGVAAGGLTGSAGFGLDVTLEPVAWLALLHEGPPTVSRADGELVITDDEGLVCRLDATTGRPLSVVTKRARVTVATRAGALAEDVERLSAAAGPNRASAERPLTTAVEFLLSEQVAEACTRLAEAFAPLGADEAWLERAARSVARTTRSCLDDDALARCDRQLAAWIASQSPTTTDGDLVIPGFEPLAGGLDPAVTRRAAAFAWRLTEQACGRDTWPAALVRAGACAAVGSPAVLEEVTLFMGAKEHGPLAHVIAASLCPMQPLAATLARRGQERLSTVAFHTDCYPLTAVFGPLGLEDVLVSALRGIDDGETRALGTALAGDPALFVPLVERLRSFATHDDALVGLQQALDAWWQSSLKEVVARRLAAIASPRTASAPEGAEEPLTK